jgi:pSer/pThr/pTyr-binding forkhead associated (FHA) protein
MKIVLVVASGAYAGKEIAITGQQFVIGRDEGCNLRPASPAISKTHCAVYYKDGQPHVRDMGSTNGTFLNDAQVEGEMPIATGDKIRVGPLDFTVKLVGSRAGTPPVSGAVKATPGAGSSTAVRPVAPVAPSAGAAKSSGGVKPLAGTPGAAAAPAKSPSANAVPSATSKPTKPTPPPSKPVAKSDGDDDAAAMLLGMSDEDGDPPYVPEGSTVMEMPAVDRYGNAVPPKPPEKQVPVQEDSSTIARDLLSKMTRRPR